MSLNMSETFRSSTPYRAVAAVINAECSHLDDVIRGCGITDDFWTITSRPALAEFCEEQNFDRLNLPAQIGLDPFGRGFHHSYCGYPQWEANQNAPGILDAGIKRDLSASRTPACDPGSPCRIGGRR